MHPRLSFTLPLPYHAYSSSSCSHPCYPYPLIYPFFIPTAMLSYSPYHPPHAFPLFLLLFTPVPITHSITSMRILIILHIAYPVITSPISYLFLPLKPYTHPTTFSLSIPPYTHGCSSPHISRPMHAPMANLCYMNSRPSNPLLSYLHYPRFLPSLSTRGRTSSMTSRALHVHLHPSFSVLPTCCPFSHMHEALPSYQIAEEATNTVKSTAKSAPSRVIRGGSLITK